MLVSGRVVNYDRAIEWTDGRLVRIEIATDITNSKEMEDQLRRSQKMEAVGTLAGGIAHNFNNVLMGIQGRASVTDTGMGMDDATREKIFDPFFSTKDTGQGSGLGLASVYGIIKNHGGFINVYSEKGIGTTFTIYLPASEKEAEEQGPIADRQGIQYGRGTVLLVDDEDMIVDVGKEMLERLGYRVLVARSGEEALDMYGKQKEEIDLVILDMIMPGMGGGEVFDRLKEMDRNVKVLLSSGYSVNGQAKEIMDRGCGGFLQKPFAMEELSRKVKETLEAMRMSVLFTTSTRTR